MSGTKGLTRQQMADRVAREFQDGWIVNLGVGIPTMCSNTDIGDREITYHSENGVIGYGPVAARRLRAWTIRKRRSPRPAPD
jgi:acyl CoA:acetate/3-ketoacid CoA transferase beta subunit